MSNYAQTNIYRRQMQKLGLNTKQYAKLIEMPYEVVKDIIYDKEGDYNMDIKNLLRKNMVKKHQEIENDFDNAKIKTLEIKNNEIDYLEWYDKEYHFDMLKDTLKDVKLLIDFEKKYCITINGVKASHWFYSCLTSKTNYKKRKIRKEVIIEFAKQLYDILVSKNIDEYRDTNTKENKDLFYINWFEKFNFEKFLKENNLTKHTLAKKMGVGYSTICLMCQKKYRAIKRVKQLYNIINKYEKETSVETASTTNENFVIDMANKEQQEVVNIPSVQVIGDNATNNELLRKILINRLTEEEKMLIELFGGKVE